MRNIEYLIIHCAATKPSMTVDVERIRRWHLKRGWNDIGYHYYIRQDGTIEPGRPVEIIGAHVKGYNSNSIGICYEGGVNEEGDATDTRTEQQKATLVDLLRNLQVSYPNVKIKGHRDFPNVSKSCPSFDVRSWCHSEDVNPNW